MKVSKMILVVAAWLFFASNAFGQEKLLKEDFAASIAHKWKVNKAELNGQELPADIFANFSVTYHSKGTYDVIRNGDAFSGTWRFSEEHQVIITNDKDGIERHKVLEYKDGKLVTETLHKNGTMKVEMIIAK